MFERTKNNNISDEKISISIENKKAAIKHVRIANNMQNQHYIYASHMFAAMKAIMEHYNLAIKLDPTCVDAYLELSSLYYIFGASNKALKCLDTALEHAPEDDKIYLRKVSLLENLHRIPEALLTAEKAMLICSKKVMPVFQDRFLLLANEKNNFVKYMDEKRKYNEKKYQFFKQKKLETVSHISTFGIFDSSQQNKDKTCESVTNNNLDLVRK